MKTLNDYINEWRVSSDNVSSITAQYFIYRLTTNKRIKIFSPDWPHFEEYKDKVYVNGEHVELNNFGWTTNEYKTGIYKIEIKDINDITNCKNMFWNCTDLIDVPLFDTSKVENMNEMFTHCENLKTAPKFNTKNVKYMINIFWYCYQLKEVPLFDISKIKDMSAMFTKCNNLSEQTKQEWSQIYDFEKEDKKK